MNKINLFSPSSSSSAASSPLSRKFSVQNVVKRSLFGSHSHSLYLSSCFLLVLNGCVCIRVLLLVNITHVGIEIEKRILAHQQH